MSKSAKNDNCGEVSFFDVKELYDAAYAEKAKAKVSLKRFQALLAQAEEMDLLYRTQLGLIKATRYKVAA